MKGKDYSCSSFYCTKCGRQGIPILRPGNKSKEAGHLKKIWCLHCQKEINHVECSSINSKYTYQDFIVEYEFNNFTETGERKLTYNQLREAIRNGSVKPEKSLDPVRDSRYREEHIY